MPTTNVGPGSALELQAIADFLGKSRKVIVVTGAGISTNCGIPDFRSENGLYSLIQAQYDAALQNPPWEKEDNFDIDDRPKKKRRVTDRWYYEVVPGTGLAAQDINSQPLEQESCSTSHNTTGHNTPAAKQTPVSSPLSSPRSITPPSKIFETKGSSILSQKTRSLLRASSSSSSRSLRSQTSRSSSVFTTDDTSKESLAQSDSSAPSCSAKTEDITITTEPEEEPEFQSSPPSSTFSDILKDAPQLSQSSSSRTLPNLKGRDLFDSMVWSDPFTTSIFYMFISSLREKIRTDVTSTTTTHKFIRVLRDGGRLVRNYTQNIDSLEEREGLCTELTAGAGSRSRFHAKTLREPRPVVLDRDSAHSGGVECVLLHGSLGSLRCGICSKVCSWEIEHHQTATLSGSAPDCPACVEYSAKRTGRGRRGLAVGRLRPDIVLYGEEHPNANLIAPLITHDLSLGPDFLLIMGTSLKVHGLKVLVKEFAKAVHVRGGKVVFVNRTKPPESIWGEFIDYWVEWDCDEWVLDLQERREDIWLPQGSQAESSNRRESSGDTKAEKGVVSRAEPRKPASRPQAVRDDRMNAVYTTFKILDSLGQIEDSSGAKSARPIYWGKISRTTAAPVLKAEPSKQARKSLPSSKTSSKGSKAKKRKSYPGTIQDENGRDSVFVQAAWDKIRTIAPSLAPKPPEQLRSVLRELHINRGFPDGPFRHSFQGNHFPTLSGLDKISLITHPPSGADVPIHTPKSTPKQVIERKPAHSYGTRASARLSGDPAIVVGLESSIVVDDTPYNNSHYRRSLSSWNSIEDTIIVATPPSDETPPTPPTSDPMTPSEKRIKRLASIGAILSSPEDSGSSSIYFDANE